MLSNQAFHTLLLLFIPLKVYSNRRIKVDVTEWIILGLKLKDARNQNLSALESIVSNQDHLTDSESLPIIL